MRKKCIKWGSWPIQMVRISGGPLYTEVYNDVQNYQKRPAVVLESEYRECLRLVKNKKKTTMSLQNLSIARANFLRMQEDEDFLLGSFDKENPYSVESLTAQLLRVHGLFEDLHEKILELEIPKEVIEAFLEIHEIK